MKYQKAFSELRSQFCKRCFIKVRRLLDRDIMKCTMQMENPESDVHRSSDITGLIEAASPDFPIFACFGIQVIDRKIRFGIKSRQAYRKVE